MKQPNQVLLIAGLLGLLALPGCYTQLSMTHGEREYDREYTANDSDTSAVVNEGQDEGYQQYDNNYDGYTDNWHPRFGFNYYYPSSYWPSYAFNVTYGNPWAYFDGYWPYDAWRCGTPYVSYPYYGYGYYPSYFYSSYSYPYHNGYTYAGRDVRRGSRTFGETRGGTTGGRTSDGAPRYQPNTPGTTELPRGSRVASPAGAPAPRTGGVIGRSGRTTGTSRGAYVPRTDGRSSGRTPQPGVRGSSPRGGNTRGDARQAQPRYRTPQSPSAPPSGGTRAPSGDGGARNTPSYTPPAQHSSPPPAPAPSGGRGGDTRGRRP
jgi:hypothetical protein